MSARVRTSDRARAAAVVALLTALSLALRLAGLDHAAPQTAHADERVYLLQAELLADGRGPGDDPMAQHYPTLVPRIGHLVPRGGTGAPATLEEHLARANESLIRLRAVVACLSVLLVPATYLLARRFLARAPALVASALAAASVLDLWYAQEARPHAAATALDAIGLFAALELRRRPTFSRYVFAGLTLGVALAVLQSALALLPAILVAHVLRKRLRAAGRGIGAAYGACIAIAIAYAFHPASATVGAPPGDGRPEGEAWRIFGHRVFLDRFDGSGFATLLAKLWEFEPWMLLACALALALFLAQLARTKRIPLPFPTPDARRDAAVVAAFALPYLFVIGLYGQTFERFALPLLPCAAIVAAWAAYGGRADPRTVRGRLPVLAGALLLAQGASAVQLARLRARDDTLGLAAHWIAENAGREGTRIVTLPFLNVPLVRTRSALAADAHRATNRIDPWIGYLAALDPAELDRLGWDLSSADLRAEAARAEARADPGRWLDGLDADLVLFGAGMNSRNELLVHLRNALRERATLAVRIAPHVREDPAVVAQDFPFREDPRWLPWTVAQFRLRALGPAIEVWRVR